MGPTAKELELATQYCNKNFIIKPLDPHLKKWECVIIINGYNQVINIELPQKYPLYQPKMKFLTPVFHPNVKKDGSIDITNIWKQKKSFVEVCLFISNLLKCA